VLFRKRRIRSAPRPADGPLVKLLNEMRPPDIEADRLWAYLFDERYFVWSPLEGFRALRELPHLDDLWDAVREWPGRRGDGNGAGR